MSLQVWLPLTKDLRNQGLSNTAITNSGATYSATGGKLGGCYIFDGSDDSIGIGDLSTLVNTDFTFACWFYHDDTWSSKGYETLLGGPSGFELESKVSTTNSPVLKLYNWGGGSCVYELNKWNHVVFTRNTTETKLYLNGELQVTGVAGTIPSGNYFIGAWKTSAQQNFKGNMNDVRIYDHCLSPMEVKELAKGLVLHYPLNRQGWGQENLYTGSRDFSGTWVNSGNWTTSTETYEGFTVKQKSTVWGGLAQNITCTNGDIFTVSFYAKVTSGGNILSIHRSSLGNVTTGLTILGGNFSSSTNWVNTGEDGTQWKRYWATVQITSSDITYLQWRIENSVADKTLYVCGMKLEKGSIATPWCPNSSDVLATTMGLNSTTEYDCSGFCNNGTRTGTFTWTSDTPKYSVSQVFSGNQRIEAPFNPGNSPTFTVAGWFYHTGGTTYYGAKNNYNTFICLEGGRYFVYNSAGSAYVGNWTNTANTWQHVVLVHDATTTKLKLYINGSFVSEVTTNGTIYGSDILDIGGRQGAAQYSGKMSDFRIYATALSADDVKSLYQNCATIDPDGTIRGQIRS